jgi:hypothetical protein
LAGSEYFVGGSGLVPNRLPHYFGGNFINGGNEPQSNYLPSIIILTSGIVKERWHYLMIVKLSFQSRVILILSIPEIQHQDKGADRTHPGWEEKRRPRIERNHNDQSKRDQVVRQSQPEQHENCQQTEMVEISPKFGPIDHVIKLDRTPPREYNISYCK